MFTEEGIFYMYGNQCVQNVSVSCYGNKEMLEMYTSNFKASQEQAFNDKSFRKSKCCLKFENYKDGKLAIWTGKTLAIDEDDQPPSKRINLDWQGVIGFCVIYIGVSIEGSEEKARKMLDEIIQKARTTDFTKI